MVQGNVFPGYNEQNPGYNEQITTKIENAEKIGKKSQCKPLNVISLGHIQTDNIIPMKIITDSSHK